MTSRMIMAVDTIQMGPGQQLTIVASTPQALEVESRWDAGGSAPRKHFHPHQEEHFEILSGRLTVQLGSAPPRTYAAGETVDVPRGVVHCMWNPDDEPASASWRITPALKTEQMFRYIDAGMSLPRSLALLVRFRNEFRLPGRKT